MSVLVARPHLRPRTVEASHWWSALVRYFTVADTVTDTDDRKHPRRYPPRSYSYLQDSAMRREMDRL
jgi:hypothetical protein